jgi:hypothetical protein
MSQQIASQGPLFLGQTTTVDFASITREPVIVRPREERLDPGSTITLVIDAKNPACVLSKLAIECDVIFVLPYLGPMLRVGGYYDFQLENFTVTNPLSTPQIPGFTNNYAYPLGVFLGSTANGGYLGANVTYKDVAYPNPFLDPSYPYISVRNNTAQFDGLYAPPLQSTPLPAFQNGTLEWFGQVFGLQADRPFPAIEPHKGEGWIGSLFTRIILQASNGQIIQEINGVFGYSAYHKLKMYLENDPLMLEQYDYYAGTNIFTHSISPFPDLFSHLPGGHKLGNSVTISGLDPIFNTSVLGQSLMTVTKHVVCVLPFPLDHFPAYFLSAGDSLQLVVSLAPALATNFTSNPQLFSGSMSMLDDSVFASNSSAFNAGMVVCEANKPIQDVVYSPTLSMFDYALGNDNDTSPVFRKGTSVVSDGIYSGLAVLLKAFYLDTEDITALLGNADVSLFKGVMSGLDADETLLYDPAYPLSQIMSRGFTAFIKISSLDNPEFTASNALGPPSLNIIKDIRQSVGRPRAEHRDVAVKVFANQIHSIFVEPLTSLSTAFPQNVQNLEWASELTQHESLAHKAGRVRIELINPIVVHLPIQDAMYGATLQAFFTASQTAMAAATTTTAPTQPVFNTPSPSFSFNQWNTSRINLNQTLDPDALSSGLSFANLNFTLQYTIAVGAKCMPEWPHFGYTPMVPTRTLEEVSNPAFGDNGYNWTTIGPEAHHSVPNATTFLPPTPDVLPFNSYSLKNLFLRYDYSLMPESLTQAFLALYTRTGVKLSYVQPFTLETTLQTLNNRSVQFNLPVTTPCGFSVSVHQTSNQDRGGPVYLPVSPFSSITITLGGQQVLNNIPSSHLLLAAGHPYPLFTPNSSSGTWTPNPHIITRNSGIDFFLLAPLQMTWSNIAGKADYPVNLGVAVAFQDHFSTYWAFNSSGGCSIHKINTPILLAFSISSFFHPSVVYPVFNFKGAFLQDTTVDIYPAPWAPNLALISQTTNGIAPNYTWNTSNGCGYPAHVNGFEAMFQNATINDNNGDYTYLFSNDTPIDQYAITSYQAWPEVPYPCMFTSKSDPDGTGLKMRVTVYQAISLTCRAANLLGGSAALPSLVFTS